MGEDVQRARSACLWASQLHLWTSSRTDGQQKGPDFGPSSLPAGAARHWESAAVFPFAGMGGWTRVSTFAFLEWELLNKR